MIWMLTISYSTKFKKDFKAVKKRGYDIALLEEVLEILCNEQPLPEKYATMPLQGTTAVIRSARSLPIGRSFTRLKRMSCCYP